jgi:dTDP-4-amino-4,6-dideoxygalactose transaminase
MLIKAFQKSLQFQSFAAREPLYVGKPNLGRRSSFITRVKKIWATKRLSNNGPMVQEFEKQVAEIIGVRHAVAICNATAAIEIACHALGLKGEVILPSYTFVATAHALQWQGIKPVFCDMDPATHNINPAKIERLISPKTTGIVGVHLWGRACDTDAIEKIASKHKLRVMYDASHAFGCSHRGRMIGSFGECEVFSFHATKFINCLEGGVVATNNGKLAYQMRMMTNFGFTGYDQVEYLGINGKMNEISAAMGLTNLEAMDEILEVNRRNYHAYKKHLTGIPGVFLLEYDSKERNNFQYVILEVNPASCPKSRDKIVEILHLNNVIARKYFWPGCHRMQPYRTLYPAASENLPITEKVSGNIIVLPTGQQLDSQEVRKTCLLIRKFCK